MNSLGSNRSVDNEFDELRYRLDDLERNPSHDNEATRHDRIVIPFLTNPLLLGWDHIDLVAQASITIPTQVIESHIFRNSTPKIRKPDILVQSPAFQFNALVVEEKTKQPDVHSLNGYRFQLHEYQASYECVWGLLTDGERWILKKGFESYHTFNSLDELQAGLSDIQHCIGKQDLLRRKLIHGTCDLVIVVPSRRFQTVAVLNNKIDDIGVVANVSVFHQDGALKLDDFPLLVYAPMQVSHNHLDFKAAFDPVIHGPTIRVENSGARVEDICNELAVNGDLNEVAAKFRTTVAHVRQAHDWSIQKP